MTPDRSADLAAIRRFVQVVENTQWQRNADAFLALFTPDAVWTNPMGRRLIGLEEIAPFTRQSLAAAPRDVFATYTVDHVVFPADDVAIVNVRSRAVRADRSPIPGEPDGAKLYVLVRHRKDWLLATGHNTFVMEISVDQPRGDEPSASSPTRGVGEIPTKEGEAGARAIETAS
jgi:uncharacterized protein (TIGR02246 family)